MIEETVRFQKVPCEMSVSPVYLQLSNQLMQQIRGEYYSFLFSVPSRHCNVRRFHRL